MGWDHVTTGMAGENPQLFSAVKGGVLAFSKSLARALAPEVRVNVLGPGWIETSFGEQADREFHRSVADATPLGRWGRPRTWPRRRSSSPRPKPRSSPARRSTSTAAS